VSPPWVGSCACEDNFVDIRAQSSCATSRAAGVSPPCVALTHLQRRYRKCSGDCRPACWRTPLQSRSCNHGGVTPAALVRARSPTDGIATFTMHKRTSAGAAGVSPPCRVVANRMAGGITYIFGNARPSQRQERRA